MSRFDLIFSGELVEGADPRQVRRNLEALFKTDAGAIARLFTGKPVVIRKDLDQEAAERYRAALQKAGALCRVRRIETDQPGIAALGEDLDRTPPPAPAPLPDISGITLAPPGTPVLTPEERRKPVPPPPDPGDLTLEDS